MRGFRIEHVFDHSQTEQIPGAGQLPEPRPWIAQRGQGPTGLWGLLTTPRLYRGAMTVAIRRFRGGDADALAALCAANQHDAVADPGRDGFVQGALTASALTGMARAGPMFVADDAGVLAGFVGSGPPPAGARPSPVTALVAAAPAMRFRGRPLGGDRWILYGPVVVDRAYRNRGIARRLYDAVRRHWAGRAEAGVLFIDETNTHSIAVHIDGMGMERIGRYTYRSHGYAAVAFAIGAE